MSKRKRLIFYIWLIFISSSLMLYIFYKPFFAPENIQRIFFDYTIINLIIYFILGTLRGFTLIPCTPMVIAGTLFLPLWPLFLVNLVCIFTSSTIVYYCGKYLEFDLYFNRKFPQQMIKLKLALQDREILVAALWAFFPIVPTDLICFTSEIVGVKLWKCLIGVGIGEGVLCAIYIFGGNSIINLIF